MDYFYKFYSLPVTITRQGFHRFILEGVVQGVGVKPLMSSAYHLQIDGQAMKIYQCLKIYLRCKTMQVASFIVLGSSKNGCRILVFILLPR